MMWVNPPFPTAAAETEASAVADVDTLPHRRGFHLVFAGHDNAVVLTTVDTHPARVPVGFP